MSEPNSNLPAQRTLDRAALERVLQRAAELQAHAGDVPDEMTEDELVALGQEVGLTPETMRQAIAEERTRVALPESEQRPGSFGGVRRDAPHHPRQSRRSCGAASRILRLRLRHSTGAALGREEPRGSWSAAIRPQRRRPVRVAPRRVKQKPRIPSYGAGDHPLSSKFLDTRVNFWTPARPNAFAARRRSSWMRFVVPNDILLRDLESGRWNWA